MKIVQVVSGLGWDGGAQEYVAGLSRALRDAGHEVVILTGGRPPPDGPAPHALADGLDVRYHPRRRIARRYLYPVGLWSSLRDLRAWADVVHVYQPFFVGTWVAAVTRAPLVATFHLHPEHVEGVRRRWLLSLLLRRLDLVIADTHAELELVRSVRTPRRSAVAWPALWERPQPRRVSHGRPLVLSVGRLAPTKGLDTTLRALSQLPPDVELAVVGGGPEAERCRELCTELGMDAALVLRGDSLSDHEVDLLLSRAAVFISASRQEAFGIAPMKAIAHGCRAVLSDIPSHREIVVTVGADEGLLFDPDIDPSDLALLIMSALSAPSAAPEVATRVPTWHDSARRVAEHYRSLVEDRQRRRWRSSQRRPDSSSTSR
jgi:glycosyltransferase involved in cell wall biosynthesis